MSLRRYLVTVEHKNSDGEWQAHEFAISANIRKTARERALKRCNELGLKTPIITGVDSCQDPVYWAKIEREQHELSKKRYRETESDKVAEANMKFTMRFPELSLLLTFFQTTANSCDQFVEMMPKVMEQIRDADQKKYSADQIVGLALLAMQKIADIHHLAQGRPILRLVEPESIHHGAPQEKISPLLSGGTCVQTKQAEGFPPARNTGALGGAQGSDPQPTSTKGEL